MPASSQASSELSTASFTVVSNAFRGLSKPKEVPILGEEFANANIALLRRHRLSSRPAFLRQPLFSDRFAIRFSFDFGVVILC